MMTSAALRRYPDLTQLTRGWISQLSVVLTGQVFSLMGSGIVQFAIIWWLNGAYPSQPSVLAIGTVMGVLPVILFSPLAGVIADKYNRKKVMIAADAGIALVTLLFFLILPDDRGGSAIMSKSTIYILLFLRAAGTAFHQPALEAAMPQIIPRDHLVRGAAITQMLRSGVSMLAPMLGAVLYGLLGNLRFILLVDVATAGVAIVSLLLIRLPDLERSTQRQPGLRDYLSDLRLGYQYVFRWKGLRALIIMFALANFLLAPVLAMIAKVITVYFDGDASSFAFFEMALAVGLMLGSLSLSVWGGTRRKIIIVNAAQIFCGLFIAGIALIPGDSFGLVLGAAALIGIASAYVNSPVMAILQAHVDKEMLGRVMSVGSMLCSLAMPVSLVIIGPLSDLMLATPGIGLMPVIWVPGLLSTLLGAICFLLPSLMRIEEHAPGAARQHEQSSGDAAVGLVSGLNEKPLSE